VSERTSRQIARQMEVLRPLLAFMTESEWGKRQGSPEINDFVVGNPHDMPIEEFGQALARASMPENPEWFAYKMNEPEALRTVVKTLREFHGMPFEEEDILMTSGAFAGIAITLRAVVDAGDEVI